MANLPSHYRAAAASGSSLPRQPSTDERAIRAPAAAAAIRVFTRSHRRVRVCRMVAARAIRIRPF